MPPLDAAYAVGHQKDRAFHGPNLYVTCAAEARRAATGIPSAVVLPPARMRGYTVQAAAYPRDVGPSAEDIWQKRWFWVGLRASLDRL